MFTVGVDANPATRPVQTGTEVYTREVARRLPDAAPELRFVFYASRPGTGSGIDLTVLPQQRLWSQIRLPRELWRRRPDLFFAPSHVVPFLAPGLALTVVHDLAFERYPAAYGRAAREYLRLTTRWAERRCRRLLTVSDATARDLVELHGVRPERIAVVPLGVGEGPTCPPGPEEVANVLGRFGIDRPFALHVGRVEAKKNQISALEAVELLPDLSLVCAGPIVDRKMAARLDSPRCRLIGSVTHADLESLYACAEVLVFPSLYEGFGLPILEAMRRGLPVVTAAVSSLPEVGGEAALYVDDPTDARALAAAVEHAMQDRRRLAELGREQAAKFTWERTAAGVAGVIRDLLE